MLIEGDYIVVIDKSDIHYNQIGLIIYVNELTLDWAYIVLFSNGEQDVYLESQQSIILL